MTEKTAQHAHTEEVERTHNRPVYLPATDIYETPKGLTVVADMPGVDEKSVNIHLEKGILTITGHGVEEEPKEQRLLYSEYRSGDYQRSFSISEEIETEKIEANIKNGVLSVILPKLEKAKPRNIPIRIEP